MLRVTWKLLVTLQEAALCWHLSTSWIIQVEFLSFLLSVTSSYISKGSQPLIDQELSREPKPTKELSQPSGSKFLENLEKKN